MCGALPNRTLNAQKDKGVSRPKNPFSVLSSVLQLLSPLASLTMMLGSTQRSLSEGLGLRQTCNAQEHSDGSKR